MSENIKHECGVAFIRLLKPLEYYYEKYGSNLYALNKLYLLMEKQHNRGQDGVGVASVKLSMPPGTKFIDRVRSNASSPIKHVFSQINAGINEQIGDNKDLYDRIKTLNKEELEHYYSTVDYIKNRNGKE